MTNRFATPVRRLRISAGGGLRVGRTSAPISGGFG